MPPAKKAPAKAQAQAPAKSVEKGGKSSAKRGPKPSAKVQIDPKEQEKSNFILIIIFLSLKLRLISNQPST